MNCKLERLVRLPLLPVMCFVEGVAFVSVISIVWIAPDVAARIVRWAQTLPDLHWYIGRQSNRGMCV